MGEAQKTGSEKTIFTTKDGVPLTESYIRDRRFIAFTDEKGEKRIGKIVRIENGKAIVKINRGGGELKELLRGFKKTKKIEIDANRITGVGITGKQALRWRKGAKIEQKPKPPEEKQKPAEKKPAEESKISGEEAMMGEAFVQMRPGLEKLEDPSIMKSKLAILIDIPSRSLHILENGKITESYEVAVADPPYTTPIGLYRIVDKKKDPWWGLTKNEIKAAKKEGWWGGTARIPPGLDNPIGPYELRLSRNGKSTNYLIHGTDSSHVDYTTRGCFSVWRKDAYIKRVFDLVPIGTPVQVTYESVYVSADKSMMYIFEDSHKKGTNSAARIYEKLKKAGIRITPKIERDVKSVLSTIGTKFEADSVELK